MERNPQSVNNPFTFDVPAEKPPSEVVIEAISTVTGRNPIPAGGGGEQSLDPLYSVVDPDALDGLFQSNGPAVRVTFSYHGYEVTVHGDRRVTLEPESTRRGHRV